MATVQLTAEKFKAEVFDYTQGKDWNFKGDKPAIIDFYADWCGPCKKFTPIFESVAEEFNVPFVKVNVDKENDLAVKYSIRSIPTVIILKDGEVARQNSGSTTESRFRDFIQDFLDQE